jgi:hypothetical protein
MQLIKKRTGILLLRRNSYQREKITDRVCQGGHGALYIETDMDWILTLCF